MWPLVRPVADRGFRGAFGKQLAGADIDAVVAFGTDLMSREPYSRSQLREVLGERWPDWDANAMAYAASYLAGTVQVTPRGVWGETGPAALQTIESWLGRAPITNPSIDDLVLRYLAAFGPASVADVQMWSGLTKLREVVDRLRPGLRLYADEDGRELFDVPDGPLPEADTPEPIRFLPEFDNLLLSHARRERIIADEHKPAVYTKNLRVKATYTVDGLVAGLWTAEKKRGVATLTVTPFGRTLKKTLTELEREGTALLRFLEPDAKTHEVVTGS